jgi:poly-gamma-glutamate synthesis protein (capsule biosynthesis protein)
MNDRGTTFSLVAVGDLQLGDSSVCVGFGFNSRYSARGLEPVLTDTRALFGGADIVFGNLECTLSGAGLDPGRWHSAQMRGTPSFARQLREAGFTVLNVANNHAVQHGASSFEETLAILRAAGIAPCGVRGTEGWCSAPVIVPVGPSLRVGVLGYCHRPRQYGTGDPPYAEGTLDDMLGDVSRLKTMVDYVVVSLHWGEEFVPQPSRGEVRQGRALVEAGASLILGHHPHVLRPVHRYRQGLIAYSLGNFVADMVWHEPLRRGAVLACTVGEEGVRRAEVTRTRIDEGFVPRRMQPAEVVGTDQPGVEGLEEAAYTAAIAQTIGAQRLAAYGFALRNLHRFPPRMLVQLAGVTLRNKISAVLPAAGERAR